MNDKQAMRYLIRIVQVSGENAFHLFKEGKISLSALVFAIAEELYKEGFRRP